MAYSLEYSSYSTKGIRPNNQDTLLIERINDEKIDLVAVAAVADGMGGMAAGHVASEIAIRKIKEIIYKDIDSKVPLINSDIKEFIKFLYSEINESIIKHTIEFPDHEGMGTTLTAAFIFSNTEIYISNVGDSRANLVYADELIQITVDHDVLTDSKMKGLDTSGNTNLDLYANALTRSMGATDYSGVDIFGPIAVNERESLILCSDGFYKFIQENEILNIYQDTEDLIDIAEKLVDRSYSNGSDDNISIICINYLDSKKKSKIKNPEMNNTKNKIGVSLIPLIILTLYIGYLFFEEYQTFNESNFNQTSDSLELSSKSDTLNFSASFGVDSNSTKLEISEEPNSSKSLRLVCTELEIPFPRITNLSLGIDVKNNYLEVYSNDKIIKTFNVIVAQKNEVKTMFLSDSLNIVSCNSEIKNILDSDTSSDSSCLLIQSNLEYMKNDKIANLILIIVGDICSEKIDSPIIVVAKSRDFSELMEIIEVMKSTPIKIENGMKI